MPVKDWENLGTEAALKARLASGYAPKEAIEDWRVVSITPDVKYEDYYYVLMELKGYSEYGITDYKVIPADIRRTKIVNVTGDELKNL